MALDQEIAQQQHVTKNGTSLRPADGPSKKWLARHFPPYRHSEGIGHQPKRFRVTPKHFTGFQSSTLAKSASRLGHGQAVICGCTLFVILLWFTMFTTLLLFHQWSALLGTVPASDTNLNSSSMCQQSRPGRPDANPSFGRIHEASSGPYFTSSATTHVQHEQLPRHRLQISLVKALKKAPQLRESHTLTSTLTRIRVVFQFTLAILHQKNSTGKTKRGSRRRNGFLEFTLAILHQKTFRLFKALRSASSMGDSEHEPVSSGYELWTHTPPAAARSLLVQ